jgi:predicted metal-dependent HD superfamily phosphohydrolase
MSKSPIVLKAEEFVSALFLANLDVKHIYHNFEHSRDVASAAKLIGENENLKKSELEIVELAALFHDTGYIETVKGHEEKSAEIARKFLAENNYELDKVEMVVGCILATTVPQKPISPVEKVICDADLIHLGRNDFAEKSELLRYEIEQTCDKHFSDSEWITNSISFLSSHEFHTEFAKQNYGKKKNENLFDLQKKLRKKKKKENEEEIKQKIQSHKFEVQKGKVEKPEKGIETMFRIVFSNHMRLSSMADNKSHIMISVNTILISIVVSFLLGKLHAHPYLMLPTILLLLTSLSSMVLAILVTKPTLTLGAFTEEDIEKKKTNLLFFGNFYNSNFDIFEKGISAMMNDKSYLYGSMIKDFYYLGKVIGRKYKLINICYYVFMIGMIVSVIAYAIAILMLPAGSEFPISK